MSLDMRTPFLQWLPLLLAFSLLLSGCGSPSSGKKTQRVTPIPSGSIDKRFRTTTWVHLSDWLSHHKAPVAVFPRTADKMRAVLRLQQGTLVIEEGTRLADWNGTQLWLGYGPKVENGRFFVHTADLHQTIYHLIHPPTPARPGARTIVIDPGHGGTNKGARNMVSGRYEKEYTFDIAARLKPLLEQAGWRVLFTRTSDRDLALTERVALSNKAKPDLFLSLHFNAAGNTSARGVETYLTTPKGLVSTLTRGYSDDPNIEHPNNAHDALNLTYALAVQRAMVKNTGLADRGVRKARFMTVIRGQQCPSLLVEGGFFSNPEEARLIAGEDYRQRLARSIALALR